MVHMSHSFISNVIGALFNKLSIPSASMPEVIEMVACLTFMCHMLDESLLNLSHPYDYHMSYSLSHSRTHV